MTMLRTTCSLAIVVAGLVMGGAANADNYFYTGLVTSCMSTCDSFDSLDVGSMLTGTVEINTTPGGSFGDADIGPFNLSAFNPALPSSTTGDPITDNPLIVDSSSGGSNGTSGTTDAANEIVSGQMLLEFSVPPFNSNGAFLVIDLATGNGSVCLFYATAGCIPGATEVGTFEGSFQLQAAQLTSYSQDFESLDQGNADALGSEGWLVYGNVFDSVGTLLFNYGVFPAPNGGAAFSAIDAGQGGPNQGAQQLSVYNDYNCCMPDNGHFNFTDIVESLVFREQIIGPDDIGTTWVLRFDAKRGNIEAGSIAFAFIRIIDPDIGFALTFETTIDMTGVPVEWAESIELPIVLDNPEASGKILQFGFGSRSSAFEGSGVFYDNIAFEQQAGQFDLCTQPLLAIPDNDPVGLSADIFPTDTGIITDLDVSIVTQHTWVGDLIYTLEHADTGTSVVLIDRPGLPLVDPNFGCASDNIDVTLDDAAGTAAEDQCEATPPAIGGVHSPNNPLSFFNGESLAGTWTLTVTDNAGADLGSFDEWCLRATVAGDTDGDGVLDDVDNCTDVINPGQEDFNGDQIGNACDADVTGPGSDGIVSYSGEVTVATGAFAALTPVGTPASGPVAYNPAAVDGGFAGPADILSINLNLGGFCFSNESPSDCPGGGADVPITSIDGAAVTFTGGLPTGGTTEITVFSPTFGLSIPIFIDHTLGIVSADGGGLGTVSGVFAPDGPAGGAEDCFVNFLDLQRVKDAFFATPASPAWDPEVDFDNSNLINFADLQLVKDQLFGPPGPSAAGCN